MSFRALCLATAAISAALFAVLTLAPGLIWGLFGIEGNAAGDFGFRRAGVILLGVAVIAWGARDAAPSPLRRGLALGFAVMMGGLAALGLGEWARGFAGAGILVAAGAETALAVGFARLLLTDRGQG